MPLTWKQGCAFSEKVHRHHQHAPPGGKWALGVVDEQGVLHGAALCGRPIARFLDDGLTVEINRTATDGWPNANSALYGACWRVASAMGYRRVITYTQDGETGASLRAAGFGLIRNLPARGSWAAATAATNIWRLFRDPVGSGGAGRVFWAKGEAEYPGLVDPLLTEPSRPLNLAPGFVFRSDAEIVEYFKTLPHSKKRAPA